MGCVTRRVLVVEDERLVAAMLGDTLRRAGFEVEIAHDALEAVRLADAFDPDGALIDVHLGSGPSGLHLGRRLGVDRPELRLIFLSRFGIPTGKRVSNGLPPRSSFLSKDTIDDPARLVEIIGDALRSSEFSTIERANNDHPIRSLTYTQLSVLRLAALGMSNQAISKEQGTVVRNIEQHLQRVYETLGIDVGPDVNPRVEAIRQYIACFGIPTTDVSKLIDS